jgi:hypothetical protein
VGLEADPECAIQLTIGQSLCPRRVTGNEQRILESGRLECKLELGLLLFGAHYCPELVISK